jgi:hypothetical protein
MGTILTFAILPLFCLLGAAITLTVVIYLVFRNLNLRNLSSANSMNNNEPEIKVAMKSTQRSIQSNHPADESKTCQACGAENPQYSKKCGYCGSKLI